MDNAKWTYKGFDVELSGERFRVNIDGVNIFSASLSGAKKRIDKHLKEQESVPEIDVPIVWLESRVLGLKVVKRARITGIDPATLRPSGAPRYETFLPDTADNEALLLRTEAVNRELSDLKSLVRSRSISSFLGVSRGRDRVSIEKAALKLLENVRFAEEESKKAASVVADIGDEKEESND